MGEGSGPVWLQEPLCRGDEAWLGQCKNATWRNYDHSCFDHLQDVSVFCYDQVSHLSMHRGTMNSNLFLCMSTKAGRSDGQSLLWAFYHCYHQPLTVLLSTLVLSLLWFGNTCYPSGLPTCVDVVYHMYINDPVLTIIVIISIYVIACEGTPCGRWKSGGRTGGGATGRTVGDPLWHKLRPFGCTGKTCNFHISSFLYKWYTVWKTCSHFLVVCCKHHICILLLANLVNQFQFHDISAACVCVCMCKIYHAT